MSLMRQMRLAGYLLAGLVCRAAADFDYVALANQDYLQSGDATFYGQKPDQDDRGACSYSEDAARSMNMSWTFGAALSLAINKDMFDSSKACGTCIMYKGVGGGIGVTPVSTTQWYMGFVNNICPECSRGALDQDIDGDGRWRIQWYAVPCNVGNTKMRYDLVERHYYWFSLVVSNTRIPISAVSIYINGKWIDLQRAWTNQWPYHRENGDWQGAFPMPIRVTSVLNETVEDIIQSQDGNVGNAQFAAIPGPSYVSAGVPGRGYRPDNAFELKNPGNAVPNLGPIQNATAYGVPSWSNSSTGLLEELLPQHATGTTSTGNLFSAETLLVDDWQQCGGMGGECTARDRGEPVKPCIPGAWPMAICQSPGYTCQAASEDQQLFKCQPSPLGASAGAPGPSTWSRPPEPSTSSSPASSLPASSSGTRANPSPSNSASHAPGPQHWQARPEDTSEVASGGRRLLLAAKQRQ